MPAYSFAILSPAFCVGRGGEPSVEREDDVKDAEEKLAEEAGHGKEEEEEDQHERDDT